ncbi:MAG: hypothetical protein HYR63_21300 [Proteobacteria bacterium]|nr:hypothetical protein [Pseudomonadota bacterium]MBI3500091.1 hypothetical protein [Pseudomonadota bacterium]
MPRDSETICTVSAALRRARRALFWVAFVAGQALVSPGSGQGLDPTILELTRLAPRVTPMPLAFDKAGTRLVITVTGDFRAGDRRSDRAETRVDLKEINPDGIELMKSPFIMPGAGPVIDRFLKIACQRQKRCVEFGAVDRATGDFLGRPDRHDSVVIDVMAEAAFEDVDAFVQAFQRLVLQQIQ